MWHLRSHHLLYRSPRSRYEPRPLIPCSMDAGNLLVMGLDTLIKSEAGRPFPLRQDDWIWVRPSLPAQLKIFVDIGYRIVWVEIVPEGMDIAVMRERVEGMITELVFDPLVILAKEISPRIWTTL